VCCRQAERGALQCCLLLLAWLLLLVTMGPTLVGLRRLLLDAFVCSHK
jgi:hypothetical protein